MKKVINYLFIPALLIASAFSCTNVREVEVEVGSAVTTISAYMDEASTKTGYVIDEQNHVARFNWLESDQIDVAVKMGDSYTPVRFLAKEAGFKASFKEAAGDVHKGRGLALARVYSVVVGGNGGRAAGDVHNVRLKPLIRAVHVHGAAGNG